MNELYVNVRPRDVHGLDELYSNGLNDLSINVHPLNVHSLNELSTNVFTRGVKESGEVTP